MESAMESEFVPELAPKLVPESKQAPALELAPKSEFASKRTRFRHLHSRNRRLGAIMRSIDRRKKKKMKTIHFHGDSFFSDFQFHF